MAGRRILLIEDHVNLRMSLMDTLKSHGFDEVSCQQIKPFISYGAAVMISQSTESASEQARAAGAADRTDRAKPAHIVHARNRRGRL